MLASPPLPITPEFRASEEVADELLPVCPSGADAFESAVPLLPLAAAPPVPPFWPALPLVAGPVRLLPLKPPGAAPVPLEAVAAPVPWLPPPALPLVAADGADEPALPPLLPLEAPELFPPFDAAPLAPPAPPAPPALTPPAPPLPPPVLV